jgi:branched-chain amino acid transport system substrate-binding protein
MQESRGWGGKLVIWIIIIAVVIWGLSSFMKKSSLKTETGPIKVGVISPLTGDAAAYGEPLTNVYRLAVKEINDAGGVNGRPIELIVEDGKCTGATAASAAQKLINVDKVQILIPFCSGEALAVIPVAEAAKVAVFSASASTPDLTGKSKYFARNYPGDSAQGQVLVSKATEAGAKTAYLLAEQTDYAQGISNIVETDFIKSGKITRENFASNVTDLRQIVAKAKASNPDALIISVQTPITAQKIFRVMRDLKWKPKLFVNDVVPGDPATMSDFKDVLEGAVTAEVGADANNPIFKHVLELYKQTYGSDMPYQGYGQDCWDAMFIIRDGIKAVGYDGTKLSEWFHSLKDWKGAAGTMSIGSNGDPLVGHRAEVIKGGKVEVIR